MCKAEEKQVAISADETQIHGSVYKISSFQHPGGNLALSHARGRDATILFESYHFACNRKRIDNNLQKLHLRDIPNYKPLLDWNTPFQEDLKKEVGVHFPTRSSRKVPYSFLATDLLVLALLVYSYFDWLRGSYVALITIPLLGWLNMGVFHSACHFAFVNSPLLNEIFSYTASYFSSPYTWYHQHNISHHQYTNIYEEDCDLTVSRQVRYTKDAPVKSKWSANGKMIQMAFFEWLHTAYSVPYRMWKNFPMCASDDVIGYQFLQIGYFDDMEFYKFVAERLFYYVFWTIIPIGVLWWNGHWFINAVLLTAIPKCLNSFLFMVHSQTSHIQPAMIYHKKTRDWMKHEVRTTCNYANECSDFLFFRLMFSIGLAYQIEHHLFPSIHHYHYPKISHIVKKVCKKHNVPYVSFPGYSKPIVALYHHVYELNFFHQPKDNASDYSTKTYTTVTAG